MHILMVSADYLPNIGGTEAHVFYLSRALQSMGHQITVLTRSTGHPPRVETSIEQELRVYRIVEYQHRAPLWIRPAAIYKGIQQIVNDLGHIDLVHQHDYWDSTLAVILSKHGTRRIWTNHAYTFFRHFNHTLMRRVVQGLHWSFNGIVAVSRALYKKCLSLWGNRIPVAHIPNGVDINTFNPKLVVNRAAYGIDQNDFVVLCPARMHEQKGIIFLAQAINILLAQHPDIPWRFIFLGSEAAINTDPSYIGQVRQILNIPEESGHVRYLGNVPIQQMPQVNALADLVVLPSLWEGFSLSTLEALATGKPLIATNVGGQLEIIAHEQNGLLVPPANPQALAQAIYRLYQMPALRQKLAKNGYQTITQRYDWTCIAQQTFNFYQQVLEG